MIGAGNQYQRHQKGQNVGRRHGKQDAVQAEKQGQHQREPNAEDHLPNHGQGGGLRRLSHGLQEDEAGLVDAGRNDHAQIDPEGPDGKFGIVGAFVGSAENADELLREEFRQHEAHGAHGGFRQEKLREQLPDAGAFPCAHVEAYHGNTAGRHAHHNGDDNLEELHDNPHHRHRNLGVLRLSEDGVQGAVLTQHVVDGRHGRHQGNLGEEAGHAQQQRLPANPSVRSEVLPGGPDGFHVQKIPHRQGRGDGLADDGGYGGSHHAPAERKDKNRIENDVGHGAGQGGGHGESGAPVRPDNRVHGLAEHIKRDAQGNIKEILLRVLKRLLIHRSSEHGDNVGRKEQIQRGQHQAAGQGHHHGAADAALCVLLFAFSQADADKGAAAVAHHDRNGQRHHGQREHHRVGCIAVGAQVAGVGDEDLVDNVVKRADQKGNDAGNGVSLHQLSHTFRSQELMAMFHRRILLSTQRTRAAFGRWIYAKGYARSP